MSKGTAATMLLGGSIGILLGAHTQESHDKPIIHGLQNQMTDYVLSGAGGQVSCAKSDDPVTSEKIFMAKDIPGTASLRQLLKLDIEKGTCSVQLTHP